MRPIYLFFILLLQSAFGMFPEVAPEGEPFPWQREYRKLSLEDRYGMPGFLILQGVFEKRKEKEIKLRICPKLLIYLGFASRKMVLHQENSSPMEEEDPEKIAKIFLDIRNYQDGKIDIKSVVTDMKDKKFLISAQVMVAVIEELLIANPLKYQKDEEMTLASLVNCLSQFAEGEYYLNSSICAALNSPANFSENGILGDGVFVSQFCDNFNEKEYRKMIAPQRKKFVEKNIKKDEGSRFLAEKIFKLSIEDK